MIHQSLRQTFAGFALALALALTSNPSAAQGSPEQRTPTPAAVAEAKAHFIKGLAYGKLKQWKEAIGEFQRALELDRRPLTMVNLGMTQFGHGDYEDARETLLAARKEFPTMDQATLRELDATLRATEDSLGTLVLSANLPAGATLFIDDKPRGKLPLSGPLRVGQGMRTIRVQVEGFDPITKAVEIRAKQESKAVIEGTSKKGRLKVSESHNWPLDIELNGTHVGVTPWEGFVEAGSHEVRLRGYLGVDIVQQCAVPDATSKAPESPDAMAARAKVGTKTETATVKPYETTRISLSAEELDGVLRVESTPPGATLFVDAVRRGTTPWQGRLDLGDHLVEVRAKGFIDVQQTVAVERRRERTLRISLEKPVDVAGQRRVQIIGASVAYGIGALGLGTFAVAGGLAIKQVDELNDNCPEKVCNRDQNGALDDASTFATLSTVGVVVAGVGAGAGTLLWLFGGPKELTGKLSAKSKNEAQRVDVRVGFGFASIEGRF